MSSFLYCWYCNITCDWHAKTLPWSKNITLNDCKTFCWGIWRNEAVRSHTHGYLRMKDICSATKWNDITVTEAELWYDISSVWQASARVSGWTNPYYPGSKRPWDPPLVSHLAKLWKKCVDEVSWNIQFYWRKHWKLAINENEPHEI
jgi:hypothetical protein